MLGLTGLGQSAIAAFGPTGIEPPPIPAPPSPNIHGGGLGYQTVFEIGSYIKLEAEFIDVRAGGRFDPSTVAVFLMDPTGSVSTPTALRDSAGRYHYEFTADTSGFWTYKWQGSGTLSATSADEVLTVKPSALIAG